MNVGKKGYYYTVSVLFFAGIFLAVFFTQSNVLEPVRAQQDRVATMDTFLDDLHNDIDRAAYIAGFRSLIAMEEYIAENASYLSDIDAYFSEAFLNGTLDSEIRDVLTNATFGEYVNRVQYEATQIGMRLDIVVSQVHLYQISPWEVAVDYVATISLNDTRAETRWQYNKSFSTLVDIVGLRDPLYSVETDNRLPTTIKVYAGFAEFIDDTGDQNDTTVLNEFWNETYYSSSSQAPSFLMRMEGNFSASEFGIESLVNLEELEDQVGSNPAYMHPYRSLVDYLYFTTSTPATHCPDTTLYGLPADFKLDTNHTAFYEINPDLSPLTLC